MDDSGESHKPSRREYIIGWILGAAVLVLFFFCPNVKMTNGDTHGWARYMNEFASAEGPILYPTEPKRPGPRAMRMSEERLNELGEREREAGWWVLWNPHHLLYVPTLAELYRLIHRVWEPLKAVTLLRWWNMLASAGLIFLLYCLMIRMAPGSPYPLAWCLFLVLSPTFFRYATDGAQYPTPIFFLAVASGGIWAYVTGGRHVMLLRAGFWLALAILFHQIVSIIVPFILLGTAFLLAKRVGRDGRVEWTWFWGMAAIAILLPVFTYVVLAYIALSPTGEFGIPGLIKYATLYAHQPRYWNFSLLDGFLTNLMTFIGFYFDNTRTQFQFFKNQIFTVIVMILPALWLTSILGLPRMKQLGRRWVGLCFLWILPLLIFLSVWNPGHDFYHLFLTIPLGCLAVIGAESVRGKGVRGIFDTLLFWMFCLVGIYVNWPFTFAGCGTIAN